jgi:hypothetical protein
MFLNIELLLALKTIEGTENNTKDIKLKLEAVNKMLEKKALLLYDPLFTSVFLSLSFIVSLYPLISE